MGMSASLCYWSHASKFKTAVYLTKYILSAVESLSVVKVYVWVLRSDLVM